MFILSTKRDCTQVKKELNSYEVFHMSRDCVVHPGRAIGLLLAPEFKAFRELLVPILEIVSNLVSSTAKSLTSTCVHFVGLRAGEQSESASTSYFLQY